MAKKRPFLYSKSSIEMVIFLLNCFKQYDYQNGTYIFTYRPYKCSYLLRRESTERSDPDISLSLCIIELTNHFQMLMPLL